MNGIRMLKNEFVPFKIGLSDIGPLDGKIMLFGLGMNMPVVWRLVNKLMYYLILKQLRIMQNLRWVLTR